VISYGTVIGRTARMGLKRCGFEQILSPSQWLTRTLYKEACRAAYTHRQRFVWDTPEQSAQPNCACSAVDSDQYVINARGRFDCHVVYCHVPCRVENLLSCGAHYQKGESGIDQSPPKNSVSRLRLNRSDKGLCSLHECLYLTVVSMGFTMTYR
jgi:hypothetical protein